MSETKNLLSANDFLNDSLLDDDLDSASASQAEQQLEHAILTQDELENSVFNDSFDDDFDIASATHVDDILAIPVQETVAPQDQKKGFWGSLFRRPEASAYQEYADTYAEDSFANDYQEDYTTEFSNAEFSDAQFENAEFSNQELGDFSEAQDFDYQENAAFVADDNLEAAAFDNSLNDTDAAAFEEEMVSGRGGISAKILTVLVGLIFFTLTAVGFTTAFQTRNVLTSSVAETALVQADTVADLAMAFFIEAIQPLETLSSSSSIIQAAIAGSSSHVDVNGQQLTADAIDARLTGMNEQWKSSDDSSKLLNQVLSNSTSWQTIGATQDVKSFLNRFGEHSSTFITDKYGMLVTAASRPSDFYYANEAWWQGAWNNGEGAIYISQPHYNSSIAGESFTVATPIRDSLGNIWGIAHSQLSQQVLAEHIKEFSIGQSGYAVLVDNNASSVVDPGSRVGQFSNRLPDFAKQSLLASTTGTFATIDDQGDTSFFAHTRLGYSEDGALSANPVVRSVQALDWTVFTRQKSAEAFGVVNQIVLWTFAVGAVALIIAILIASSLAQQISKPIRQLAGLSNRVARGDLSQLANIQTNDEVGYLGQTFNSAITRLRGMVQTEAERDKEREEREALQENVSNFLDVAMDIANGDLTKRGAVSEDVLGNVVDAINLMVEEVAFLLKDVQSAAISVNEGSEDMLQTTEVITASTEAQAQEAIKARGSITQVTSSIRKMAQNAETSAESATQALAASEQGREAVTNTLNGMQNIRREVQAISKRIKSLGDRSLEISEIVDTISNISRQTNLLALNAAIEASGAGEAGRRFAIVADEVRKLADDSATATNRISDLIKGVQAEVQEVVVSVEDGTREVEQGYRVATEAGERLSQIGQLSERSAEFAQLISKATQQQVQGVENVGKSVVDIAGLAENSQEGVQRGREVAEKLQNLSNQLTQSLERFRISEA